MPRAPFQVGVLPFRQSKPDREYLLFHRTDHLYWQCIAGGGEDAETPLAAAKREAFEEAGIPATFPYLSLQTTASVAITEFKDAPMWDPDLLVVPIHYFGVRVDELEAQLSGEHLDCRWLGYDAAQTLLKWDSDKTALWELEQRLKRGERPML